MTLVKCMDEILTSRQIIIVDIITFDIPIVWKYKKQKDRRSKFNAFANTLMVKSKKVSNFFIEQQPDYKKAKRLLTVYVARNSQK